MLRGLNLGYTRLGVQAALHVTGGALAVAAPGRVGAAGQGTMNNVLLGGAGWVYYETVGGGQGARPGRDGMSGVHTGMTNTRNTPVEALERAIPVRVRRLRLARRRLPIPRHGRHVPSRR